MRQATHATIGFAVVLYVLFVLCASALTFIAYAIDKAAARLGMRRIPERTLHLLAAIGGWPGALLARALLRHKTRKRAFGRSLALAVAGNTALWVLLAVLLAHGA